MASSKGQKEIKTAWPVVEGTTFGSTKTHTRQMNLVPTISLITASAKVGL